MTHVVTENCINCRYTECVEACPAECIHAGPNFVVIDPQRCIDCALCVPVCPAGAIHAEPSLSAPERRFVQINAELAAQWPLIRRKVAELEGADLWDGMPDKLPVLKRRD